MIKYISVIPSIYIHLHADLWIYKGVNTPILTDLFAVTHTNPSFSLIFVIFNNNITRNFSAVLYNIHIVYSISHILDHSFL